SDRNRSSERTATGALSISVCRRMRERNDGTTPRSVQRRHRALLHSGTLSRSLSADPAASELVKVADLRFVQLPHRACERPARFVKGARLAQAALTLSRTVRTFTVGHLRVGSLP